MSPNVSADSDKKGYEVKDVPFRPWAWFALGFIISMLAIYLGVFGFTKFLTGPDTVIGRTAHGRSAALDRFPHPQLQTNPAKDLHKYLQLKDQELATYGWIDRSRGIVRIPIEQAMALYLKRGASVRPPDSGLTELDMQIQKAGGAKILPPATSERPKQ
jgi:hypothetical protein